MLEPGFNYDPFCSSCVLNWIQDSFVPLQLVYILHQTLDEDSLFLQFFFLGLQVFVKATAVDVELCISHLRPNERPNLGDKDLDHGDVFLEAEVSDESKVLPMFEIPEF